MGNYKGRLRKKIVKGSSIMRVFGSSYKFKEEANDLRESMRRGQFCGKKRKAPIKTERSVHAISTPFGGINKRY